MDCRLEKTRQWAVRILHEAQLHKDNWFLTLTLKEDQTSLDKEQFKTFMKRLRYYQPQVRYFMCGEYGDKKGRPHYHAIAFGLVIPDLEKYSENNGNTLWESKLLTRLWGLGDVRIGIVNMQTASYVAAYCTKKITGKKAKKHYKGKEPEYATMSLKPGIAQKWIEKYTNDVYGYDHVIINGRKQKPPRFYDKYLEKINPEKMKQIKIKRQEEGEKYIGENTDNRLRQRKIYTESKMKQTERKLQ